MGREYVLRVCNVVFMGYEYVLRVCGLGRWGGYEVAFINIGKKRVRGVFRLRYLVVLSVSFVVFSLVRGRAGCFRGWVLAGFRCFSFFELGEFEEDV